LSTSKTARSLVSALSTMSPSMADELQCLEDRGERREIAAGLPGRRSEVKDRGMR
jgi:hypothetical protein